MTTQLGPTNKRCGRCSDMIAWSMLSVLAVAWLAFAGGLAGPAGHAVAAEAGARKPALPGLPQGFAFAGRRGVGGIKTFAFPVRRKDDDRRFIADPYQPSWRKEMLGGRLSEVRRAGFDFIRINVDPGPLLAATPDVLDKRMGELEFALASTVKSGLKVVLDIHPSGGHPVWGAPRITADPTGDVFSRYLVVVRRLAQMVSRFEPQSVALEVFNEPPSPCHWPNRPPWPEQLARIHGEARRMAPRHTLIVGGACYAGIEGLVLLDGSRFDANTMFTFHYYEPHIFTHQGYWGASDAFIPHVSPLPYPADRVSARQQTELLSRVRSSLLGDDKLTAWQRVREWSKADRRLRLYFAKPSGRGVIDQRFAKVSAWAQRYNIAPARILLGEFGVMKDIYGKTGARPADRQRWLGDVRRAAEAAGFAWSVWALTNTMGIVTRDLDGPLDRNVLRALGLGSRKARQRK